MFTHRIIRRSAVLAAAAVVGLLGAAPAAQASGYSSWTPDQMANACYSHGTENVFYGVIPTTQVQQGSSGDCVAWAQYLLVRAGAPGYVQSDVDGQFGPQTNGAVRAIQQRNLTDNDGYDCGGVDGQVGPLTWWCLEYVDG